ncbi:HEAT repeat domain-containing protein [Haloglomus litoreum]|uniref:HEAT repeat domain-containing protein n=1 Tax=Haloglomus litoreum TaxID=3034026 RepID=UPI0023E7935D|nr:HEAT repeat domain-containing protein [Haloglomus sp. DT116]
MNEQLDEVAEALEAAETEADLDDVEADLDDVAATLEAADLPEPDEDDEDAEDPRAELEARVEELRDGIEEARGPYAEDVVAVIESAQGTLGEAEWTERGETEAVDAVATFLAALEEQDLSVDADAGETPADASAALDEAAEAIEGAGLDADEDAETLAALVEAADALESGVDDAETWDDLSVRQKMTAEGFYDRLTSENRKDFPPELSVVRIAEQENDPERILMALEYLTSEFMEENCIDAFRRMGSEEAYDAMMERAQKRDRPAIEVLGKIADDRAVETLVDYIQDESNPPLQRTVLRALGEIGSEEATQDVADRLVAEDAEVRARAARTLGMIGDTRAIDPLASRITEDDDDSVRAAAAWALNQIGTERALESAAAYADDRAFIVQDEAQRAADALGKTKQEA